MKFLLIVILLNAVSFPLVHAQSLFAVFHEKSVHLVKRVSEQDIIIDFESEELKLPINKSNAFLKDAAYPLPGYLEIEKESAVAKDSDDQDREMGDAFFFRYQATVTPNRDLDHPYIVFQWVGGDQKTHLTAAPLDPMKADETVPVFLGFFVRDRYRLVEPNIHFMSMGFEIGTSKTVEKPLTPYQFAVQRAAGGELPDGNIKPLSMVPLPTVHDAEGNPRTGVARLRMRIDERGYVSEIEVVECTDWAFGKAAMMVAPFGLFQPKIIAGEPVATKVIAPFKFK